MPETDTIPVSASVASTGLGIRYIGNLVYAYSGALTEVGSLTTALEFTSGSELIIGKMQFDGFYDPSNIEAGNVGICRILFNDEAISTLKIKSGSEAMPQAETAEVIIPPLTKVLVQYQGTGTTSQTCFIRFTGTV